MSRRRIAAALVLCPLLAAAPAGAQEADFCRTLAAAWTAARDAPASLAEQRVAGASLCALAGGNLQCTWLFGTKENGRAGFLRLKAEAAACLAPLGLAPSDLQVAGAETTLIEGSGTAPQVAVIYPGNATVSVAILPPQP